MFLNVGVSALINNYNLYLEMNVRCAKILNGLF
jgi:hypothetical protein